MNTLKDADDLSGVDAVLTPCESDGSAHSSDLLPPWAFAVFYAALFYGYDTFLAILYAAGIGGNTRPLSVGYRGVMLGLVSVGIAWVIFRRQSLPFRGITLPLAIFLTLYVTRVVFDTVVLPVPTRCEASYYILILCGSVIPPMLLLSIEMGPRAARFAERGLVLSLFAFCTIVLVFYREFLGEAYRNLRYTGVQADVLIGGLAISYAGAMLVLVSLYAMGLRGHSRPILHSIGVLVGVATLFFGGSRGPLLAVVVGLCFIVRSTPLLKKPLIVLIGPVLMGTVVFLALTLGESTFERSGELLPGLLSGDRSAGSNRIGLWTDSLEQFLASPLVGSGFEEKKTLMYPHNAILEAFMATGIVGGAIYIVILIKGIRNAAFVLKHRPELGWLSLLFVLAATESMVSGTIWGNPKFWVTTAALQANAFQNRRDFTMDL